MTPLRWTLIWAVAFWFLPVFFSFNFLSYIIGTVMGFAFLLIMNEVTG